MNYQAPKKYWRGHPGAAADLSNLSGASHSSCHTQLWPLLLLALSTTMEKDTNKVAVSTMSVGYAFLEINSFYSGI